jgi:hypothetical protein
MKGWAQAERRLVSGRGFGVCPLLKKTNFAPH